MNPSNVLDFTMWTIFDLFDDIYFDLKLILLAIEMDDLACHILYSHQVQFRLYRFDASLHFQLVPNSTLHESLISSYYHSSCIILLFTFYHSPFFPVTSVLFIISTISCFSFNHSCSCVPLHHSLFFACDSFVPCYILSFPSLTIACDILYLHFTPISVVMTTPYMSNSVYKSQSLVLCSLVCN